ncbi:LuxR C-terminal-related transcriptional regulator [Streptomyces sp. T028]|uniref:LuxR C-terminal-related transcriptional regulator n=1 Tax=Streptomyces sp. T028 TaxID=3394379 RepID=UPI003A87525E
MEGSDRLLRLAKCLLSASDWTQLLFCVGQAFENVPEFRGRIWVLGSIDTVELARFPVDAVLPSQSTEVLSTAAVASEVARRPDGTVFVPLRSLGVQPMLLELHGFPDEELSAVEHAACVVASRAAYLAMADPDGRIMPAHRGTEEVARAVRGFSTALQPLLRHDRLTVFLLTAGDRAIERFAVAGAVPLPDEETIFPISEFGLRDSLMRDLPMLTEDIARDRAPHSRGARILARAGFRSSLSVPLRLADQRLGMVQFLSRTAGFYCRPDIRVAQDIADHAAPFIDHLRRQESVRPAALREAIETERTRLARDLGRVSQGVLVSARQAIGDLLTYDGSVPGLQGPLAGIGELLDSARAEINAALADIAPPPLRSRPFERVLRETVASFTATYGVAAEVRLAGDLATLSMTARRMGHGVMCAGLAAAHAAGARRVRVSVTVDDDLLLNVTDDGARGQRHLDIQTAARGELQTIAECAQALGGRVYTEYESERGTTLVLDLPRTQPIRRDLEDERWLAAVPENEPTRSLRVFVLDQQGVRRAGLTHFLDAQHELRVVGHAAAAEEARRSLGWLQPDVVFVDAEDETAADTTREVRAACSGAVVIGLTSRPGAGLTEDLAAAGMAGVLRQNLERAELLESVTSLVAGGTVETHSGSPGENTAADAALNSREWATLRLIAEGLTNAEIGAKLYLAPKTIERHVASIVRKLGARNRVHLVAVAIGRGMVRPAAD